MDKVLINLPETIESKNIILQMPKAGFGEKVHKAIADGYNDYIKWLNWPIQLPTIEDVEVECRKHHAEFITREFIRYLIIEKDSQKVVGRCAFPSFQANWLIPQFGISYFIAKGYRKQGYATEAVSAMAKLAFNVLGAKKIEIFCDKENIASAKVPQKLGFKLEYTTKGSWPRQDNALTDLQCYVLFSKNDLVFML